MSYDRLILAFGFGNLALLGWLAAAAAPLLIHLWSRHRFRETQWAAVQFLLAAMKKNARRMQLQQWLLLAVRTLLIVLVVLAVAEPYGAGLLAGGSTSAPTHKILVIDGSYSMAYREGSGDAATSTTHFTRAKQLAAELLRSSTSADSFTLIVMTDHPTTVVGSEVIDASDVAARIESLPQTDTGADLSATLSLATEAMDGSRKSPRAVERQEVYFFTDLQQTTWGQVVRTAGTRNELADGKAGENAVAARLSKLANAASVVIVDVGAPRTPNFAITQFATADSQITLGREVSLAATLHEFSDQPRPGCKVELSVDDQPVGEQTVDLPAGGDANVHFSHRFNAPGMHTLTLRASRDALVVDNSRYLVLPVAERIRVLCVAGREGAAKYIVQSLNPQNSEDSAIEPVVISEADLVDLELTNFDCIFLCNVAQLTRSEAERLGRYVEQGGGLVTFLGDHVLADQYNGLRVSNENSASGALFPWHIGDVATPPSFGIDPLNYRHPIVAPFRGRERAGLLTTPISRFFQLALAKENVQVEVAAATAGGDPLIVTTPLGRGRSVVVATDGSLSSVDAATGESWTTWPTWPSFLPIVRELLAYATAGKQGQWQRRVGQPLSGILATAGNTSEGRLEIVRPDGKAAPLSVTNSPDGPRWSYDQTDVSGIYNLRGADVDAAHFAVNVDTAESNLAKIDSTQLPPELIVRDTWRAGGSVQAGFVANSAWNVPLLWAAFVLLFVESFLAWRFGRGV